MNRSIYANAPCSDSGYGNPSVECIMISKKYQPNHNRLGSSLFLEQAYDMNFTMERVMTKKVQIRFRPSPKFSRHIQPI